MSHYLRNPKRHSEHFSKKAARTRGGDEASQILHLDQKSLRFSPGYRLSIKHINSSAEKLASFKTQAMKERLIYIHQGIQATLSILRIMLSSLSGHWDTSGQICCHLPACLESSGSTFNMLLILSLALLFSLLIFQNLCVISFYILSIFKVLKIL